MQMQIDFKALEQALAPIAGIGQGELTFDAGNTTITVRVLRPAEEVEAQKFAAKAFDSGDDHAAVEYLDLFRLACLSHAIVAVGSQDFRNVEFVDTGTKLDNGQAIKVPKHKAMRELLTRWTRAALTAVFAKFHELLMRKEKEAEKAIIYEPANIPSEIDRLNKRIEELRTEMAKADVVEKSKFSETVAAVEGHVPSATTAPKTVVAEPEQETDLVPPVPVSAPTRRAGPISPRQTAPPVERPVYEAPQTQQKSSTHGVESSFVNTEDDDAMNASMAAEHERLVDMRRRAAQGQQPRDEASALERIHPQMRRRPPHMDAAEAEEELRLMDEGAHQARHLGNTAEGVPVYAMPAQDLEVPGGQGRPSKSALDPKLEAGGSKNPRFQSPRKP